MMIDFLPGDMVYLMWPNDGTRALSQHAPVWFPPAGAFPRSTALQNDLKLMDSSTPWTSCWVPEGTLAMVASSCSWYPHIGGEGPYLCALLDGRLTWASHMLLHRISRVAK
jgi:hypothetical protein